MSTPTPAGSKPAPTGPQNAATPQSHAHLAAFSSPAQRSVNSPAQRTQAGKSPFGTTAHPPGSTSNTAAMNHPTTGSSASGAGRLLASSPAAAMLNFDSPAGMALSLSNMGGLDGGIGMGISMSGLSALNLGTSMGGRGDDEDRRKRLEAVVNLLKSRPARVCPEGLELLSKRVGMEVLLEPPDGPTKDGTRECAIAGGSVLIDVSS
jgi:Mediator of RNA polymerase II transcription subunit 1